jgi:phage shock protein A
MNDGLLIFLASAGLLSIVLIVVIWQLAASWRAKAVLAREAEYRTLGDRAIATQQETQPRLEAIGAQLTAAHARLAAIERSLTVID